MWNRYTSRGDVDSRNELVEAYMPRVRGLIRGRRWPRCPSYDVDDLVQAAYLGLIEATERFDPSRGVVFTTYYHRKVLGHTWDYVRSQLFGVRGAEESLLSFEDIDDLALALPPDIQSEVIWAYQNMVKLDLRRRLVLHLFYVEKKSLQSIAELFDISYTRVSQLKKTALSMVLEFMREEASERRREETYQ